MKCFLVVLFVALAGSTAYSQVVVFDNFQVDGLAGGAGGASFISNAAPSDLSATIGAEIVDNVSFAQQTFVTGINWTGTYSVDAVNGGDDIVASVDDNFEIRVYSDATGQPGAILSSTTVGNAVNRNDSGVDLGGLDVFDFSASIDFTFEENEVYWLSVLNNTTADDDNFNWGAVGANGNAFADINPQDGNWVFQNGIGTDFQLTTTAVPEPSSVALAALGLLGFIARRRRR